MSQISNHAPGLKTRKQRSGNGVVYYWVAAQCARNLRGFPTKSVRLDNQKPWGGPDRARQCQELYRNLVAWLDERRPRPPSDLVRNFDGKFSSLLDLYCDHPQSPITRVKWNTAKTYFAAINILRREVGSCRLDALTGVDFLCWHGKFIAPSTEGRAPRVNSAHQLMAMVRASLAWGVVLEIPHCERLKHVISAMRFVSPRARTRFLSLEQARNIILTAHHMGRPSIALAQALQFELTLRQKDVIGEWQPSPDGSGKVWGGGLTWENIKGGVLRKTTTKTGAEVSFDLSLYPLVERELARHTGPRHGPLVINETTGKPFVAGTFAEAWRRIANASGVPRDTFNMDSRSGGITEATDAGASVEAVRHHAGHRAGRTTERYSRNTLEKSRSVARLRVASRGGSI